MTQAWWILGLVVWLAWAVQATLSVLIVRKFRRRLGYEPRAAFNRYRPPAAVIVPFKGLEPDLDRTVRGLFEQDYGDYRLLLVVDSPDDPACAVLREQIAAHPNRPAELLVAGVAGPNVSQKVHNQLHAIGRLHEADGDEGVWVFADSDAVPGPGWLGDLVGPLGQDKTAVTTGYRWLVPAEPATFWSKLASVLNSSVAGFQGRDLYTQAWGGSMAIRVQTARQWGLVERLTGAMTDDYPLSRLAREAGRRVYFVPRCLVPSPVQFTFASFVNFVHRQYLITRVYAPWLFLAGIALPGLYVAGFISAVAAAACGWATAAGPAGWGPPLAAWGYVMIADQVRATYRRRVVERAFDAQTAAALRSTLVLDRWTTPLCMAVHLLLVLRAAVGRTMTWRGIRYRLLGPNAVRRMS